VPPRQPGRPPVSAAATAAAKVDAAQARTQARLDADPSYQAQRGRAQEAERTARHAAEKARLSAEELSQKGESYRGDPLFMYLWQIAHFLLLQIRYGREYERAGLPSLAASMNGERFGITVFVWILATAGGALLFPVFYVLTNTALMAALILGICLFVIYFHGILVRRKKEFNPTPAFRCMYLFQGFVFALLIAEGLLANSSFSPAGSPPVSSTLQALSSNSVRCSFFLNACAFLPLERWMNRKPQF